MAQTSLPSRHEPLGHHAAGASEAPAVAAAVRTRYILALALLPFLALVALHWSYGPLATRADYAQYLLHAKALLEGRGYTDIGYIFTARNPWIGPRAYPPGLPLTLVPILAVVGPSWLALKLLTVLSAAAFLLLAGSYIAARCGVWLGAGVVLLCGMALELQYATNTVASDLGFCALVWGAVVLADRPGRWSAWRIALITVLGLAAMAYRAAGVPLVPALLVFALRHSGERRRRALIPAALWGVVLLAAATVYPGSLIPNVMHQSASWWATRIYGKLLGYRLPLFELLMYPLPGNAANDVYHALALAVTLVGLAGWVRAARRSFLLPFTVLYLLMLLVVPMIDGRYLWPVLPVLALGFLNGLRVIVQWVRPRWPAPAPARAAVLVGAAIAGMAAASQLLGPRPRGFFDSPDVRALFSWIQRERARQPIRVAFVNPRVLTWETGVPAMGVFAAPPDTVLAELRAQRITHVVLGHPLGVADLDSAFRATVAARPNAFAREFERDTYVVYRVIAPR